jgi:glycerophosphoryl diester phosphodiesterase
MLVIAHRGASLRFGDNTIAAFRGAVDQGADGVELDVRRTSDGALAVSHDDALADGRRLVDLALAELPEDMLILADALAACRPLAVVNIEIKNWPGDSDFDPTERLAHDVVALLDARGELDDGRALVTSFHLPTVDTVHGIAPGLATGWLLAAIDDPAPLIDTASERGHVAINPHHASVNAALVERAHATGLAVNTWTVDDPDRIRWLADLGVDAAITNTPDVALRALGR